MENIREQSKTILILSGLCALLYFSCNSVESDAAPAYTGTWICNAPDPVISTYDTLLLNEDGTFSRSEKINFHTMDSLPYRMVHWGKFTIADDSITCSIDSAKICGTGERYDLTHATERIRRQHFQTVSTDSILTVPFFWDEKIDTLFGYGRRK